MSDNIVGTVFGVPIQLDDLQAAIRFCWSPNTSQTPEDTQRHPAAGQCAVTVLVVQDYMGGKLMRTMVTLPDSYQVNNVTYAGAKRVSHYFNILPNGNLVDMTLDQFPSDALFNLAKSEERSAEYVLSFPEVAVRYHTLSERVKYLLSQPNFKTFIDPEDEKKRGEENE